MKAHSPKTTSRKRGQPLLDAIDIDFIGHQQTGKAQPPQPYHLPLAAFDNHVATLGKTGSGKTYTMKKVAEDLLDKKEHLCIIDPTDVWWGMRSAYPLVVFGGRNSDFPLPANSGALMAEIVAKHEINVIFSTKLMTTRERTQWFTDFAEALMRLNTQKLHLFIDEAHNFMPQGKILSPQAGMMLAAGNELLSGGRAQGLCIVMITQRPAKLHKDSLTQAECLVVMRLIAPQDRKAVMEWMGDWVEDPAQGQDLLKGLPSLKKGEGWFWAPEQGILRKGTFPKIKSFDSSAAPSGVRAKVKLAKIDLPAIQAKLGAAADEVKANDPKELKAEIARLQSALRGVEKLKAVPVATAPDNKAIDKAREEGRKQGWNDCQQALAVNIGAAVTSLEGIRAEAEQKAKELRKVEATLMKGLPKEEPRKLVLPVTTGRVPSKAPAQSQAPKTGHEKRYGTMPEGGTLSKAERAILTVLAQAGEGEGRNKKYIALRTGYAIKGGGFNNAIGSLNSAGCVERRGDMVRILHEGVVALGSYEPLPTGIELRRHWLSTLGKAEALILGYLCEQYPSATDKMTVALATGYEAKGGGFSNAIGRLRTLELIEGGNDAMKASAELF